MARSLWSSILAKVALVNLNLSLSRTKAKIWQRVCITDSVYLRLGKEMSTWGRRGWYRWVNQAPCDCFCSTILFGWWCTDLRRRELGMIIELSGLFRGLGWWGIPEGCPGRWINLQKPPCFRRSRNPNIQEIVFSGSPFPWPYSQKKSGGPFCWRRRCWGLKAVRQSIYRCHRRWDIFYFPLRGGWNWLIYWRQQV